MIHTIDFKLTTPETIHRVHRSLPQSARNGPRQTQRSVQNTQTTTTNNPSLQTFFYTYTTKQGVKKQFAIKRKLTEQGQNNEINLSQNRSINTRTILTTIMRDAEDANSTIMMNQTLNRRRFSQFVTKQKNHCANIQNRYFRRGSQADGSYVDFCLFQNDQQRELRKGRSFYDRHQILQLVDSNLSASQGNTGDQTQSPKNGQKYYIHTESVDRQSIRSIRSSVKSMKSEVSQIDPKTKSKFRQLLGKSTQFIEENIYPTANEEVLQKKVDQWLDRHNTIIGDMQQQIENFNSMMKSIPESSTKKQDKDIWHIKKDLIKRVGLMSKSLKKREKSISQMSRSESTISISKFESQFDQEKRSFIQQLLSLDPTSEPLMKGNDLDLQKKRNEYWKFDRKGRNLQQLREKSHRSKIKKFGIIFSREVRTKFDHMRAILIQCVRKLKIMRLSAEELMSDKVILRKPYQREGAYIFFKAVNKGESEVVKASLVKCRYFIFDVDYNFQTALHICSRKGDLGMTILLLKEGSYPDTQDLAHRTPLFYALQGNKLEIVRYLLYYQADPWSYKGCNYHQAAQTPESMKLLKIARRLRILMMMTPYIDRDRVWNEYRDLFLRLGRRLQST